jgi:hypothetical protein
MSRPPTRGSRPPIASRAPIAPWAGAAAAIGLSSLIGLAPTGHAAERSGSRPYRPRIDPAEFKTTIDNPYFPLVPGTVFRYVLATSESTVVTVTHETKVVMGVPCVVVHEVCTWRISKVEDTFDWYAQDRHGTLWYFGEYTEVSLGAEGYDTEGSWQAGVGGAEPGVVMWARPRPGRPYRQEYLAGHAEDMAQVIAVGDTVIVPAGSFRDCVRIREWSPLERGAETKWYAPGVGLVRSHSTNGEVTVLVSVSRP